MHGLGHEVAGHFKNEQFTYFDPNGGVLHFGNARHFVYWFPKFFPQAKAAKYDIVGQAEFDYYFAEGLAKKESAGV
jgi:hypothetical protein